MYSSYNKFNHNVYRDANIVTTLDTLTSLLAGVTIFGILGHLAHVIGTDDISSVIKGGANVAFISYPDAIARFDLWPQVKKRTKVHNSKQCQMIYCLFYFTLVFLRYVFFYAICFGYRQ